MIRRSRGLTMAHRILAVICCLCGFVSLVESQCNSVTGFYNVSETSPNGTVLFNYTKQASMTISFTIKNDSGLTQIDLNSIKSRFFLLEQDDNFFSIQLKQTLDLELLHGDYHQVLKHFVLVVKCGGSFEATVIIKEVNEFPPVFISAPYNVTISESLAVNGLVFDFTPRVHDNDIPPTPTFYYHTHDYNIQVNESVDDLDLDGKDYFNFSAETRGELKLRKHLDYDTMDAGRKYFLVNVSVADGQPVDSKSAFTALTVIITDADDQKPYFDYPQCGKPCVAPPYEALVSTTGTGVLNIRPAAIAAKDDDTLGTRLLFSIQGNDYNMFSIDQATGVVRQTKSVIDSGLTNSEFRLIIKVRKDIADDLSSIAILSVKVAGRQPNGTDPVFPSEDSEESKSSSDLLIPVIILGVLLLLLIAAIIVVVVLMRRKQRQMTISPEDKSEPQTEEEEIHDTDRSQAEYNNMADTNEKLIFGKNTTTRAISTDQYPIPEGRAGQLPPLPLRDSATETTEVRKKKRSRKRNRNKEPEIFDGTREYNMGLDPEFFDSTDKSKIKRSQRSKKADSTLPINVPNDQPPETQYDSLMHM